MNKFFAIFIAMMCVSLTSFADDLLTADMFRSWSTSGADAEDKGTSTPEVATVYELNMSNVSNGTFPAGWIANDNGTIHQYIVMDDGSIGNYDWGGNLGGGGARVFGGFTGGDFTKALYWRSLNGAGYATLTYGEQVNDFELSDGTYDPEMPENIQLYLEPGKYQISFLMAAWKFEGEVEGVYPKFDFMLQDVKGNTTLVKYTNIETKTCSNGGYTLDGTSVETVKAFTINASGYYILKFECQGYKELLMAKCKVQKIIGETIELQNTFVLPDLTVSQGSQATLQIGLDNSDEITGFQFDLVLPEGVSVQKDGGDHVVNLSSGRASYRNHNVSSNMQGDGSLRVVCSSNSNKVFAGSTGTLVEIPLEVSQSVAAGSYTVKLKNIELATPALVKYNPADVVSTMTVESGTSAPTVAPVKVESYVGNSYEGIGAGIEGDIAKAVADYLGVTAAEEVSMATYDEAGNLVEANGGRGETDGWRNADGAFVNWGTEGFTYHVEPYAELDNGAWSFGAYVGSAPGAVTAPIDFTQKVKFYANGKSVEFPITLSYVNRPELKIEVQEEVDVPAFTYDFTLGYAGAEGTFDISMVEDAIGCTAAEAEVFGFNPSTEEAVRGAMATFDGWHAANGDLQRWGEAPFCIKFYNNGTFWYCAMPDVAELGATYKTAWLLVNPKTGDAVQYNFKMSDVSHCTIYFGETAALSSGKEVALPIYMNNENDVCNLQFDIELPTGMNVVGKDSKYSIELNPSRLGESDDHIISSKLQKDGSIRILISSLSNASILNQDVSGADLRTTVPLVNVKVKIDKTVLVGDCSVKVKNAIVASYINQTTTKATLSDTTTQVTVLNNFAVNIASENKKKGTVSISSATYDEYTHSADENDEIEVSAAPALGCAFWQWHEKGSNVSFDKTYKFTLKSDVNLTAEFAMLGDVYEDGLIDVGDLTELAGIILRKETPIGKKRLVADMNKSEDIEVGDFTMIVGIIHNGYSSGVKSREAEGSRREIVNLQFDIELPFGIDLTADQVASALRQTSLGKKHSVMANTLSDGRIRVIAISSANSAISKAEETLTDITVPSDLHQGVYGITLRNVVFAFNDYTVKKLDEMSSTLSFTAPTGIDEIDGTPATDGQIFDINGRKLDRIVNGINVINGKKVLIK